MAEWLGTPVRDIGNQEIALENKGTRMALLTTDSGPAVKKKRRNTLSQTEETFICFSLKGNSTKFSPGKVQTGCNGTMLKLGLYWTLSWTQYIIQPTYTISALVTKDSNLPWPHWNGQCSKTTFSHHLSFPNSTPTHHQNYNFRTAA